MSRKCGACSECCTQLQVTPLMKPQGQACPKLTERGCGIHSERYDVCRQFICSWLEGALPKHARPDKVGAIVWRGTKGIHCLLKPGAQLPKDVWQKLLEYSWNLPLITICDDQHRTYRRGHELVHMRRVS